MRRTERTHQLKDDGVTDARATEVKTFRRDVLKQAGLRSVQNELREREEPRASSDTPRKRRDNSEEAPWTSRSAHTPKASHATGFGFNAPEVPELEKSGPAPVTTSATRTDTPKQLKSQSSNLSSASAPGDDGGTFALEIFEPIPEALEESKSSPRVRPHSDTVNSLASSKAADFNLETSESLGFQHQLAWLYHKSGTGDSLPSSGKHAVSVNSLASSDALNVGDPGRFRRTDTLLMSNERRQREADAVFLAELRKEASGKHSNTIESLLSSWPESLLTPPMQPDSAPGSSAPSRNLSPRNLSPAPQVGLSPEPDARPSSRGSHQGREGSRARSKKTAASMGSLENIEEELDDDPSISFSHKDREKSAKAEKNGDTSRRSRAIEDVAPKAYQLEPHRIPSFE